MSEPLVVVVRGIIAFVSLLIFARVLGKQQISQMTFFEYVLGITIGSIAASMTVDLSIKPWPQWLGLLSWTVMVYALQWVTVKWRYAAKYIEGEPTIVIMDGKIMEEAMRTLRLPATDLLQQLRLNNAFDVKEVAFAILETNGKLSVMKKPQFSPATPNDLNIATEPGGLNTELIYGGIIIEQNLAQTGLSRDWLLSQLRVHGITEASEVFLATVDATGSLYIDSYRDNLRRETDIGDYEGPF